jgi:hypothetical protein
MRNQTRLICIAVGALDGIRCLDRDTIVVRKMRRRGRLNHARDAALYGTRVVALVHVLELVAAAVVVVLLSAADG